jgi:hypothetical protein
MKADREWDWGGRLAFYTAGLMRCYPFLPPMEVRQSVALGLLEADSRDAEQRSAAHAVYRLARNLGWHRIKDRDRRTGRQSRAWVREHVWIFRRAVRNGGLPIRTVMQRTYSY